MADGLKFDPTLVPSHASVKADGRLCAFQGKDGTALLAPEASSSSSEVRTLALIISRDGNYSSQVGMVPPSADVEVGLHKQNGICLWSGNVYINGTRKRVGFEHGDQPLLVWRTVVETQSGRTSAWGSGSQCTLSVYAGEEQRCQVPVPEGATHFAVSGDCNGAAHFEIDGERSEAAQREALKGEQALDDFLRDEAERAAAKGGGGGCCIIA